MDLSKNEVDWDDADLMSALAKATAAELYITPKKQRKRKAK